MALSILFARFIEWKRKGKRLIPIILAWHFQFSLRDSSTLQPSIMLWRNLRLSILFARFLIAIAFFSYLTYTSFNSLCEILECYRYILAEVIGRLFQFSLRDSEGFSCPVFLFGLFFDLNFVGCFGGWESASGIRAYAEVFSFFLFWVYVFYYSEACCSSYTNICYLCHLYQRRGGFGIFFFI